ncbi:MAG: 3-hydroxybutyryl-CoA dehydrogenase [Pseudomonadota bacterium]
MIRAEAENEHPPIPEIETIGVIGAGQMGNGIVQVAAQSGFTVKLLDVNRERLDLGMANVERGFERMVDRGDLSSSDAAAALRRIDTATTYDVFADADLVVEAASENEDLKRKIFQQLLPVVKPTTVIASNTSSISITRLGAATDRPERFIGMHFMNPVTRMKLIELIRGIATQDDTYQAVRVVADRMGKTSVTAEDFPAFIVNRILLPMVNEAVYTLLEGVGNVESIDTAMKLGANHPMGPLELADFIGLDTCLAIMQVLYEGLNDSKYRPCPLLVKYVEAGWLGRKSRRGFYDYRSDPPVPTR